MNTPRFYFYYLSLWITSPSVSSICWDQKGNRNHEKTHFFSLRVLHLMVKYRGEPLANSLLCLREISASRRNDQNNFPKAILFTSVQSLNSFEGVYLSKSLFCKVARTPFTISVKGWACGPMFVTKGSTPWHSWLRPRWRPGPRKTSPLVGLSQILPFKQEAQGVRWRQVLDL